MGTHSVEAERYWCTRGYSVCSDTKNNRTNSSMSFSIYDLEEDIRKLLNIDNFLNGLTTNEFIEELSKDHILKGAEVNKLEYLDPKPYIRTFESTLRHLKNLSKEAATMKLRAENDVDEFELAHSKSVLKLSSKVELTVSKFDHLDTEITSISNKIDPLNQALNKITNSRDRSTETIFLVRAYHGFYTKEKYEPLEKLRTSKDKESKTKCAKTVNNLLTLAKKIETLTGTLPKVTKCVTTIEKYSEMMEQALIDRFEMASEEADFEEMSDISKILFQFNGGSNVVLAFMNKSELFLDTERSEDDENSYSIVDDAAIWEKLSDPNYRMNEPLKGENTEILLDRLKFVIKGQARIVQQVFEEPIHVIKAMLQRVYAQMIQNRVSTLLSFSQQSGALAHVRILHALYVLLGDFTKEMKEFFVTNEFDENNEIGATLEQCYYDLFIEYLTGNSYFNLEKEMLESTIYGIAEKFTTLNERSLAKKALETKLQEYENDSGADPSNLASLQHAGHSEKLLFRFLEKKRISKFKDFMKTHISERIPGRDSVDLHVSPSDYKENGTLNSATVQIVLKLAIEAVARVLELEANKSPEYSLDILEILLLDFGSLYIFGGLEVAYDKAQTELQNVSQPQEINLQYLQIINDISEVLLLVSTCVKKIILPCAVNDLNIRNRMVSLTNNYVSRCETSLNIILSCTVEIVTERINVFLLRQKKKDYVCDTIDSNQDYTEVCELISDLLIHVHGFFQRYLNEKNLNNLLTKVGMITLNLLLDHFKKFAVNSTGGIVLTQDVIRYQSVIDSWDLPELSESFQILREISNLFTVQPNLINSLISEGHLASLKIYTVRQYISKRTDFTPSYMERFFGRK